MKFAKSPRPTVSPWGHNPDAYQVADGIWDISTPSHGGYYLTPERVAAMPKDWLDYSFNGNGHRGWFEEDVDWCMVALAFQDEWLEMHGYERGTQLLEAAKKTFNEWIARKMVA